VAWLRLQPHVQPVTDAVDEQLQRHLGVSLLLGCPNFGLISADEHQCRTAKPARDHAFIMQVGVADG